jgi:hypothetical protein
LSGVEEAANVEINDDALAKDVEPAVELSVFEHKRFVKIFWPD